MRSTSSTTLNIPNTSRSSSSNSRLRLDLDGSSPFDQPRTDSSKDNYISKETLVSDFVVVGAITLVDDEIESIELSITQTIVLIKECSRIIKSSGKPLPYASASPSFNPSTDLTLPIHMIGSTQLGLLLPFRVSERLSNSHQLTNLFRSYVFESSTPEERIIKGLPWEEDGRGSALERFREGLEAAEISEVVAVLKWVS